MQMDHRVDHDPQVKKVNLFHGIGSYHNDDVSAKL